MEREKNIQRIQYVVNISICKWFLRRSKLQSNEMILTQKANGGGERKKRAFQPQHLLKASASSLEGCHCCPSMDTGIVSNQKPKNTNETRAALFQNVTLVLKAVYNKPPCTLNL